MNRIIEDNIKKKIEFFLDKGYKRTEAFHTAILLYSQEIETNYHSLEVKRQLAKKLEYSESMGQEIQKLVNVGKIIRECNLNFSF